MLRSILHINRQEPVCEPGLTEQGTDYAAMACMLEVSVEDVEGADSRLKERRSILKHKHIVTDDAIIEEIRKTVGYVVPGGNT